MKIDNSLLAEIDRARQEGAVILLKWDGERSVSVYTVLVTHAPTDFLFRTDADDMEQAIREALRAWRTRRA